VQDPILEIQQVILNHSNFVIAGHLNPDGDAVGAGFALGLALSGLGKEVLVVFESFAPKLEIIPGRQLLYYGPIDELSPEVFICVDCADKARIGGGLEDVYELAGITVCVDHHETNDGFATVNFLDGNASSTSEMIYRLLDGFVRLDKDIASALYAGLVYDTGGFRFSAVGKDTLNIASRLMAIGIPFTDIYNEILHIRSFGAVKALGRVVDSSRLHMDGRIIVAGIPYSVLRECGASTFDLDGVVEFLLNTKRVEIAALLYERENGEVKVSLRSRGLSVGRIAVSLGGGGHRTAAGCNLQCKIGDAVTLITDILKQEFSVVNV
jgi:phosphoesterase RecJ-like protein